MISTAQLKLFKGAISIFLINNPKLIDELYLGQMVHVLHDVSTWSFSIALRCV